MACKRWCTVCGDDFMGDETRCKTCREAMNACDRPTYDLILGLLKRIAGLEKRFEGLPESDRHKEL